MAASSRRWRATPRVAAGDEGEVALDEVHGVVGRLRVGPSQAGGAGAGEAGELGGAHAPPHRGLHRLEEEGRRDALAPGGGLEAGVREDEAVLGGPGGVEEEEPLLLHRVAGGAERGVEGLALVVEEQRVGARGRREAALDEAGDDDHAEGHAPRGGDGGDEDAAVGEGALAVDLALEELADARQELVAGGRRGVLRQGAEDALEALAGEAAAVDPAVEEVEGVLEVGVPPGGLREAVEVLREGLDGPQEAVVELQGPVVLVAPGFSLLARGPEPGAPGLRVRTRCRPSPRGGPTGRR